MKKEGIPITDFEIGTIVVPMSGVYQGLEFFYSSKEGLTLVNDESNIKTDGGDVKILTPKRFYESMKDCLFLIVGRPMGENGEPLQAEGYIKDNVSEDVEKVLDHAVAMKHEDPVYRLQKKGFVKGMPMLRRSCMEDFYTGSGIFTGEFGENVSGITLKFTDGSIFLAEHCEPIKDVDKALLRMIDFEQKRVLQEARNFVEEVKAIISNIIYESE